MSLFGLRERFRNRGAFKTHGYNEFLTEFAEENPIINDYDNDYKANGVELATDGNTLKLKYNGLLPNSGAQDVYAAVSYGDNGYWLDTKYYHMHKVDNNTFELSFNHDGREDLNVAFKDGASNWDNNSGKNYSFTAQ